MKRKILAGALAVALAATSVPVVMFAEDEIKPITISVGNAYTARSNYLELKDGDEVTFKFTNKSYGTANWNNFDLFVTGKPAIEHFTGVEEILVIRSDNWCVLRRAHLLRTI